MAKDTYVVPVQFAPITGLWGFDVSALIGPVKTVFGHNADMSGWGVLAAYFNFPPDPNVNLNQVPYVTWPALYLNFSDVTGNPDGTIFVRIDKTDSMQLLVNTQYGFAIYGNDAGANDRAVAYGTFQLVF